MVSFFSLPFDLLLHIFRDLEVTDVIRVGMTCKDLRQAIQDRHVWVDQLEKFRQEDPVLRPATPPLTSLLAQELKTFVTRWAKLRLRLDTDNGDLGFSSKGLLSIPGGCRLKLLPGGKSLLVIDSRGGVSLRRIELGNGKVSLPVVTSIDSKQDAGVGLGWNQLLTTMSPCPILIHSLRNNESSVQILRVDHHNNAMTLETTFHLPRGCSLLKTDGQGRIICFLVQWSLEPPRVMIIHLDYPGVILESKFLKTYTFENGRIPYLWDICVPTESLAVIYNAEHILSCKIPSFSTLSASVDSITTTPMWSWHGLDRDGRNSWAPPNTMTGEVLYDPLTAQEFNLYYSFRIPTSQVVTVTVPINAAYDNLASKSAELPAPKQNTALVQCHVETADCKKGLYFGKSCKRDGVHLLVMPLKDIALRGPEKALRMFVSWEEFEREVDMDEATGRVVMWLWDRDTRAVKIFFGDLV